MSDPHHKRRAYFAALATGPKTNAELQTVTGDSAAYVARTLTRYVADGRVALERIERPKGQRGGPIIARYSIKRGGA